METLGHPAASMSARISRRSMTAWSAALVIVMSWPVEAAPATTNLNAQYAGSAPIYLFRDRAGKAYALQLPRPGDTTLGRHYVTAGELSALTGLGATIAYLPEHPDAAIGPCTATDFPSVFNIAFVGGTVFGNIARCDPEGRPSWASSQRVEFVVFTSGYRAQAAHTVVILWFKNALHGHGIYFGDTSAVPCADGRDATFNTRIEGWSQWSGFGPPANPYWTSTGPLETTTCGTPMQDGWSPDSGIVSAAYRIRIRASADQWVRYEVRRWDGSAWALHAPPLVRDLRYKDWPGGPGTFDPAANGLMIGSSGPLGAASGSRWMIGIRELSTAWESPWDAAVKPSAVEFYNAALDHYFVTADSTEIADLDHGVHAGWMRTGYAFAVATQVTGYAEPVCRFYGLPGAGLDSHFYSANSGECEEVRARFGNAWALESTDVFAAALPDTLTGACPPGTTPVYRLWNSRKDSNHRYTTDLSVRQGMLQRGFVAEGYGPTGVAMCAPPQ